MVVLLIIGLMASIVVFSIPTGSSALEEDAQRFAVRTAALRDNAILQSRPMAVQVTTSGYSFLQRRKGSWSVLEDKPFTSTNWSSGVTVILEEGGSLLLAFESTGLPTEQVELVLKREDAERRIQIAPMGDVTLMDGAP